MVGGVRLSFRQNMLSHIHNVHHIAEDAENTEAHQQ